MTLKRLMILSYTIIILVFMATSGVLLYLNFTFDEEYRSLTETVVLEVRLKDLTEDIHTHIKRLSGYYSDERRRKLDRDLESYRRILESLDERIAYEDSLRIYDQVITLSNNYISLTESAIEGIQEGKKDSVDGMLDSIDKISPSLNALIVRLISEDIHYLHKKQNRLNIYSLDSIRIAIVVYGLGVILSVFVAGRYFKRIMGFINRFNSEMHALGREHNLTFKKIDERSEFGFLVEEYKHLQERIIAMRDEKEAMEEETHRIEGLAKKIQSPVTDNMTAISTLLDMTEGALEDYQMGKMPHVALENYLKDMIWGLELMLSNERNESEALRDIMKEDFIDEELLDLKVFLSDYFEVLEKLNGMAYEISGERPKVSIDEHNFRLWHHQLMLMVQKNMKGRKKKVTIIIDERSIAYKFKRIDPSMDIELIRQNLLKVNPWLNLAFEKGVLYLYFH